mmetsp:Transcript_39207/g.59822  ORF Transcript_39207/g.59822 Transcript_39207/m.59822 type:complete len:80 (-) Transcript_39207:4347-4586(-)
MQLMSRDKIEVLKAFNSSSIPQHFPRECVTTKSQVNEGGPNKGWGKLIGTNENFQNLKVLHMQFPPEAGKEKVGKGKTP